MQPACALYAFLVRALNNIDDPESIQNIVSVSLPGEANFVVD